MATFIAAMFAAVMGSIATYILSRHMAREDQRSAAALERAETIEIVLRELVGAVKNLGAPMHLPPGW